MATTGQNLPPLYLEDFVIALRNAWLKYAPLQGNTYVYSHPGCSIDPNPRTLQRLQAIGQRVRNSSSFAQVENDLRAWHRTCAEPQSVKVMGIPFNTHFAQVMVKADYDMKSMVDGSNSLDIPGLISLTDMTLNQIRQAVTQNKRVSIPFRQLKSLLVLPK